jgi:poly(A) polymerase
MEPAIEDILGSSEAFVLDDTGSGLRDGDARDDESNAGIHFAAGDPRPTIYDQPIPTDRIDPDAVKVLRRLQRHGHTAYLVGGGVRDLLLHRRPKDFDIATSARPSEVRRLFRNCRIIGRRFRLAHILFSGGKIIEVATFRRDPTVNGHAREEDEEDLLDLEGAGQAPRNLPTLKERHDDADLLIRHDNTFGAPHEDAARRDFTINGLFYDIERQQVIDYVGGMPDLRAGIVRTIGEPDIRFREDPVRILRAIKFSARLDMGIAPEVYDAMVDQRTELERTAKPRLFEELLRLMRGGAAHRSIYLAWDTGTLAVFLPELTAFLEDEAEGADQLWGRLRAVDELSGEGRLPSDTVLLAALLWGPLREALEGEQDLGLAYEVFMEEIGQRLALPRRQRDRMRLVAIAQRRFERGKASTLARREFFADAAMLYELECRARGREVPEWAHVEGEPTDHALRRRRRRRPIRTRPMR